MTVGTQVLMVMVESWGAGEETAAGEEAPPAAATLCGGATQVAGALLLRWGAAAELVITG